MACARTIVEGGGSVVLGGRRTDVVEAAADQFASVIDTNLTGAFRSMRAETREMRCSSVSVADSKLPYGHRARFDFMSMSYAS